MLGRNPGRFNADDLNPVLRGWIEYFSIAEVKKFAEELDMWIRRRLRVIIWRQWERPLTKFKNLMRRGLDESQMFCV